MVRRYYICSARHTLPILAASKSVPTMPVALFVGLGVLPWRGDRGSRSLGLLQPSLRTTLQNQTSASEQEEGGLSSGVTTEEAMPCDAAKELINSPAVHGKSCWDLDVRSIPGGNCEKYFMMSPGGKQFTICKNTVHAGVKNQTCRQSGTALPCVDEQKPAPSPPGVPKQEEGGSSSGVTTPHNASAAAPAHEFVLILSTPRSASTSVASAPVSPTSAS